MNGLCWRSNFLTKLHRNQEHPDKPLLEHTKELIEKLDSLGITASPLDDEGAEDDEWDTDDDDESVDDDGDIEMEWRLTKDLMERPSYIRPIRQLTVTSKKGAVFYEKKVD